MLVSTINDTTLQLNPIQLRGIWQQLKQATQSLGNLITDASLASSKLQHKQELVTDSDKLIPTTKNAQLLQCKHKDGTEEQTPLVPTTSKEDDQLLKHQLELL